MELLINVRIKRGEEGISEEPHIQIQTSLPCGHFVKLKFEDSNEIKDKLKYEDGKKMKDKAACNIVCYIKLLN